MIGKNDGSDRYLHMCIYNFTYVYIYIYITCNINIYIHRFIYHMNIIT